MRIGNYEIIRQIGEGGFGRTYEARHVCLDERACLKQNINLTDKDAELLKQEAKLLWQIHHHSLPAVRDFFKAADGSYILAMSFIEGKSLDKIIEKHKALHPEEVCWISQRLLNALYYLHSKGVVHCDVKPPNIIVKGKEHEAWLIDYGLACLRPTRTSKAVGYTAIFAAPEVIDGKPPIPESDIYGLGLTMIYALGGDPISKIMPDFVPAQLQEFFTEMVRYDPAQRLSWEKGDLVSRLSTIRKEVFGRTITK
ncbi:serine/threonine protein kinase [Candidatus Woesearchaeota archaeon]|nr:serine/threonine protein kinase [Candidatus Woesearchaeota archaeon]